MNRPSLPSFVRDRLDALEHTVAQLTENVQRTQEGISASRSRLQGAFTDGKEEADLRASLMQLVEALPTLRTKLGRAKSALVRAKQFVNELPDDAQLERVVVKANGVDRGRLATQLKSASDELEELRGVPSPSSDIADRIKQFVSTQARPKITGIASGRLDVLWPNDPAALFALLMPEQMTTALQAEIERQCDTPLPRAQRQQRMADLESRIDVLQRQTLAADADATNGLPAEILLGCVVQRPEHDAAAPVTEQRIERRQRARRQDNRVCFPARPLSGEAQGPAPVVPPAGEPSSGW